MSMALAPDLVRGRDELVARVRHVDDAAELFAETSTRLRRLVPFDAAVWRATDPVTGLVNTPIRVENLPEIFGCGAYWEHEFLVEDVDLFRDLARAATPAGALSASTDDHPARSPATGRSCGPLAWATSCGPSCGPTARCGGRSACSGSRVGLASTRPRPPSSRACPPRWRIPCAAAPGPSPHRPRTLAPTVLACCCSIPPASSSRPTTKPAAGWPACPPRPPPRPRWGSGCRPGCSPRPCGPARSPPSATMDPPGCACAHDTGRWLVCHASCLRDADGELGTTALVIEPAAASEVAPILAEAYGLSARELQVTLLIARGLRTGEIAARLFLSPHTVRDHVRAIFDKVEVSSRGELVARLFAEHHAPRLHDGAIARVWDG